MFRSKQPFPVLVVISFHLVPVIPRSCGPKLPWIREAMASWDHCRRIQRSHSNIGTEEECNDYDCWTMSGSRSNCSMCSCINDCLGTCLFVCVSVYSLFVFVAQCSPPIPEIPRPRRAQCSPPIPEIPRPRRLIILLLPLTRPVLRSRKLHSRRAKRRRIRQAYMLPELVSITPLLLLILLLSVRRKGDRGHRLHQQLPLMPRRTINHQQH